MKAFKTYLPLILVCLMPMALGGCAMATRAVKTDFTAYNQVLEENQSQQMLLNLVRLHYHEVPLFMQVGTIVSSYQSSAGGNLSYNLNNLIPFGGLLFGSYGTSSSAGGGISYNFGSSPTVTYSPIDGDAFTKQFLANITPETFCLLIKSGWPADKLGRLLVERVILHSGKVLVSHHGASTHDEFVAWANSLREAQKKYKLEVLNYTPPAAKETTAAPVPVTNTPAISTNSPAAAPDTNAPAAVTAATNSPTAPPPDSSAPEPGSLCISTGDSILMVKRISFRSLYDAMFVAAKNCETPDSQKNTSNPSERANGAIKIHCSLLHPRNASVCVWYKHHYYYILNNDIDSKDTLLFLMTLYRIQASPTASGATLTLPVR
jgi:hypothetical protein